MCNMFGFIEIYLLLCCLFLGWCAVTRLRTNVLLILEIACATCAKSPSCLIYHILKVWITHHNSIYAGLYVLVCLVSQACDLSSSKTPVSPSKLDNTGQKGHFLHFVLLLFMIKMNESSHTGKIPILGCLLKQLIISVDTYIFRIEPSTCILLYVLTLG